MRAVLQRVNRAEVKVDNETVAEIERGYALLLAVHESDSEQDADWLSKKILKLRLFEDEKGNSFLEKNIVQVGGSILLVSQFTLYGDCEKGTRPGFSGAARPARAEQLYRYLAQRFTDGGIKVETGRFGRHMQMNLSNEGPVTLIIDTPKKFDNSAWVK